MSKINVNMAKPFDKKMIKNTMIMFVILTLIFAAMAGVSAALLPRKIVFKDVAGEEITASALFYGKSEEDYFMASGTTFERRSFSEDELLQSDNYFSEIEGAVEANGDTLIDGSLLQFYFLYANKESGEDNLVIMDNVGNLFKYTEGEDGLAFSDDYLLQDSTVHLIKMTSNGDDLYVLSNYNNRLLLQRYDLNNLSAGVAASRYVWTVDSRGKESSKLSFLTYDIKLWDFVVEGEYVYLATDQGIYKFHKDFYDYEDIRFFEAADNAYVDYMRSSLKAADASVKAEYELTDEVIDGMTQTQMAKIFKDVTGIKTTEAKKNAAEAFVKANEWCVDYEATEVMLTVKNECLDSNAVSMLKGSMYVKPLGMAYSSENQAFYLTNSYDDSIAYITLEDVNSVKLTDNVTMGDFAKTLELSFDGRKFHKTKSIALNQNANTLYVAFASNNTLCIVDLNEETPKIAHTFEAGFDIQEFVGDTDNSKVYFLNSNKEVDLKNNATLHNFVTSVSPERNENKGVIRACLVISALLAIVSAIILITAVRMYKNPKVHNKMSYVRYDVKKNKLTYLALVPFVILLFLFCYYEAIGSMVLSFFDYTRDNPAMDWNSFSNYIRVFNADDFLLSLGNTLFFIVFDVIIAIVPPVIFAFFLSVMRNKKYSLFVRTAMLVPSIIPGVATMLIWRVGIFGETGVLNTLLTVFGQSPLAWLENTSLSRWSLLLMSFPFIGQYLIFYGAMMNIPKDYYEAAELEGISIWRRFFSIDLPLCVPQITYVFITTIINSAQNYARTYMLRSAGTVTLAEKMYKAMTSKGADYGLSSAYAMVIFAVLFVAIIINFRMQKKSYMGDSL